MAYGGIEGLGGRQMWTARGISQKTWFCIRLITVGGVLLGLGGCASGLGLLNDSGAGRQSLATGLAMPPSDALSPATAITATQVSDASTGEDGDGDETVAEGGEPVPSLSQLAATPIDGIDPAKTAQSLETDIAEAKVSQAVQWRGRMTGADIDVANVGGTLCSGQSSAAARGFAASGITLACSDGRVATLQLAAGRKNAVLRFGSLRENVEFLQD